jgi:hypothetical protein
LVAKFSSVAGKLVQNDAKEMSCNTRNKITHSSDYIIYSLNESASSSVSDADCYVIIRLYFQYTNPGGKFKRCLTRFSSARFPTQSMTCTGFYRRWAV